MDRPLEDRNQREETIAAGEDAVGREQSDDDAHTAHRKEGDDAVHPQSGEQHEVGREGGRADHIVLDEGKAVPRHPKG